MDDRPSESGKQDDLDTARTTLPEKPAGDGQDQVIVDAEPILADERIPANEPIPADEEILELGEAAVLSDDQPAAHDEEIILLEAAEKLPFDRLGPYRVIRRMGPGGLGDVYEGRDDSAGAKVVIKVLAPKLAENEACRSRFQAAGAAALELSHDNIVPVHFVGEDAGHHFLVMQYVQGKSLARRLGSGGHRRVDDVFRVVEQCLGGLLWAHSKGVIHGDIKPSNIFLEAGTNRALLVDLGLNIPRDDIATLAFRSPEQVQWQPATIQTDIYSLGAVAYWMLTGCRPFDETSSSAMVSQIVHGALFPLAEAVPSLWSSAVDLVQGMMARLPANRYCHCAAVLADIRAYRKRRPIIGPKAARGTSASEPKPEPTITAEEPPADTELGHPPADVDVETEVDVELGIDTDWDGEE